MAEMLPHQKANLEKGRKAMAEGKGAGNARNLQRVLDQEKKIKSIASEDPDQAIEELFQESVIASLRLTRRWNRNRTGEMMPRIAIEASRETRQLAIELQRIRQARGAIAESSEFFAQLEARLKEAAPNLGERLRPYLEEPP
jgi:hypothetical protein